MNNLFSKTLYELNKKHLAAYIFAYEGENLYEFTEKKDNIIYKLTNFSGENSLLVVGIKNSYLLVDSRFTIQAKNENKNKSVKIVEINSEFTLENFFYKYFKNVKNIGINTKRVSIFRYNKIKNILSKLNIKIHIE